MQAEAHEFFDLIAGAGVQALPRRVVTQDAEKITDAARVVSDFASTRVAHNIESPPASSRVTFGDVNAAIDTIAALVAKYEMLQRVARSCHTVSTTGDHPSGWRGLPWLDPRAARVRLYCRWSAIGDLPTGAYSTTTSMEPFLPGPRAEMRMWSPAFSGANPPDSKPGGSTP